MTRLRALPTTLWRKATELWRTLWVRVVLMGALALAVIGLSQIVAIIVPGELSRSVGGAAADRLLDIIATAMLSVTIFSLTVMVSLYRFSASQWTPRVHRLNISDPTTQNTLATFIGAYVFSLTAIILREIGVFGDEQGLVLFCLTVLVLLLVVVSLVRWTLHLQTFGSLATTTRKVEDITSKQFRERLRRPCLGATPLTGPVPEAARPVRARRAGYVSVIYQEELDAQAAERGIEIWLVAPPGAFVHLNAPLAQVTGGAEDLDDLIHDHIVLDDQRSFDQDPRFGLIVMAEIGSKALSSGINDPGTAIDVITRMGRILSDYEDEADRRAERPHPHLHVPPLDPDDLLGDAFDSVARDGVAIIEVQVRLHKILRGLMEHPDPGLARAAEAMSLRQAERALACLDFGHDRERLRGALSGTVRQRLDPDPDPDPEG